MPYLPFQEETSREIQLNYALMLSRVSEAMLKSYSEERKVERDSPQKQVNVPTLPF